MKNNPAKGSLRPLFFCNFALMSATPPFNPLQCGARNGFIFGAWLAALYSVMIASGQVPPAALLTPLLMAGVPVLLFMLLRRDRRRPGGETATVSHLWADGIVTCLGGAVLSGALMLVYLTWINPGFIADNMEAAIALLAQSTDPANRELSLRMEEAVESGVTVTPALFTLTLVWMVGASGAVLSLLAAIPAARIKPTRKTPPAIS